MGKAKDYRWRGALAAMALLGAASARADDWDKKLQTCAFGAPSPAMVACTSMIDNLLEPPGAKSVALNNRARAHMQLAEWDLALTDLNKAIALKPGSALYYYNRGVVFSDGKAMPARAVQDFSQAIALQPIYAEAFNNRGLAKLTLGQVDEAVADFSTALKQNPKLDAALTNRGGAYARQKKYKAALSDVDAALKVDAAKPGRWAARCRMKIAIAARPGLPNLDALGVAEGDCAQALTLDPANPEARNGQAIIKLIENDLNGALADFQTVIAADPKNATALFGRGLAKQGRGDAGGAATDMSAAKQVSPLVTAEYWEANLIPNP